MRRIVLIMLVTLLVFPSSTSILANNIVDYDNPDFIMVAHSDSTNSASLSSKAGSGRFIIFNMR